MNTDSKMEIIDQKIKSILKDLEIAQKEADKYIAKDVLLGREIVPMDIFEMGAAYTNRDRILMDYELALSEKFPQHYLPSQVDWLKSERKRLTDNNRAFKNRSFPGIKRT